MPNNAPVTLITGASSGIGAATATLFAQNGYRVFGTWRRERPIESDVEMLELDVQSGDSVRRCVETVQDRTGRIDVLVNNAGIVHVGFAEETHLEDAHSVFETNFWGVARVTNAVLPIMRGHGQGRIINVGSLAGLVAPPGEGFYAASKHALKGYSEALRQEVAALGVHVSLVEPGFFKTNIYRPGTVTEGTIADYDAERTAVFSLLEESARQGDDPRKVARLILKVARTEAPRLRYGVGRDGRWVPLLRRLLPQRLFEWGMRWHFGLSGPAS